MSNAKGSPNSKEPGCPLPLSGSLPRGFALRCSIFFDMDGHFHPSAVKMAPVLAEVTSRAYRAR